MKKLFLLPVICTFCALSAIAIDGANPNTQLTVMVYMNAKNDLDCAAIADVKEMVSALPLAHITVIVELGRHPFGNGCPGEDSANRWDGTLFFRIKKDLIPSPEQALPDAPEKPAASGAGADVNMGIPQSLRRFVAWGERRYPAKHYILIIWGHGHGFRVQDLTPAGNQSKQPPSKNGYRAVSFDDDYQSYLFTHDFQEALRGLPKLDVLAFDSCLMAGIETAYAMRRLSVTMVGSEELESTAGWDYTKVFRQLSRNHDKTPYSLATTIVEAARSGEGKEGNPVTLSAIDLPKAEIVANRVSRLADAMIAALGAPDQFDKVHSRISAVRKKCDNYGKADGFHNPIDLMKVANLLSGESSTPEIQKAASRLLISVRKTKIVFDNFAAGDMRAESDSNGLTVYFPKDIKWYNNDPDDDGEGYAKCTCGIPQKHPVDFVCELNWASFLHVYFSQGDVALHRANALAH